MKNISLTKYPFIKGTQCQKSLWLNYYRPEVKTEPSLENKLVMENGNEIGILARRIYEGGIDVSQDGAIYGEELFAATEELMKTEQQVFYEAAFRTIDGSGNCKVDIFVRSKKVTRLIEVKSSTKIKAPQHILDIAFQYWVLKNSNYTGAPIKAYICYINNEYVLGDALDIDQLFIVEDVTQRVIDAQSLIEHYLRQFKPVLAPNSKCPNVKISEACYSPYRCSFYEYCWRDLPAITVFNISNIRKKKAAELLNKGIIEPHQIESDTYLTEEQWIEVQAAKLGKPTIKKPQLREFLQTLQLDEPTYWMDFETMAPAICEIKGTKPYQKIPFQYSVLFKESFDCEYERREFLAERGGDPRKEFIEKLLRDTKEKGSIIVYSQKFEIGVLRSLAELYPQYEKEIEKRISRIKDLLVPFAKKYYYDPVLMKGSASIKSVLPALVDSEELSYKGLPINNGALAMHMYQKFHSLSLKEQIETKKSLREYCHIDTLGMLKIVETLVDIVS